MNEPSASSPTSALATSLAQAGKGDQKARDALVDELYPRLRAMASSFLHNERADHTLQPTALVNEAWIRLSASENLDHATRTMFMAAAARTLRRVLIDHARGRNAQKRGGGEARLELTDAEAPQAETTCTGVDRLGPALEKFAQEFPRQHQVVELKYFGGLTVKQIAEMLDVSDRTIANDWEFAKAWLRSRLETNAPTDH